MLLRTLVAVAIIAGAGWTQAQSDQAACSPAAANEVYSSDNGVTNPALLNTLVKEVDALRVFPDSKTIVDMPLTAPPAQVAAAFNALSLPDNATAANETVTQFVNKWLQPAGSDMVNGSSNLILAPAPEWFQSIADPDYRKWADDLYKIWSQLTRQLAPGVYSNTSLYTMLPVPNPFVVPGARFRELYYWDTFWVLKGLVASNLTDIAQGEIRNFIYLLKTYGHIPNGIRTYYLNRSQPPLFSMMVRIVYEATDNTTLLSEALPVLLTEHAYWTAPPKQVTAVGPNGEQFNVSRYYADWEQPRPESYSEDMQTVQKAGLNPNNTQDPAVLKMYNNLASGAESGWDYSSRWFANNMNITTIRTTEILPADLNAYLLQMEENIASFAQELGCTAVQAEFTQLANQRRKALNTLFWNSSDSQWHDLVCASGSATDMAFAPASENPANPTTSQEVCQVQQNPHVFASNFIPLWAGAAEAGSEQAMAAVEALNSSGLLGVGGVAMSLTQTGQQWDYPNVWPPVQWMLIEGSDLNGGEPGAALAHEMTSRFLTTAYATYEQTGYMFEKFNTEVVGLPGGGGEYSVVTGFGWTNGAVLDLLQHYGSA